MNKFPKIININVLRGKCPCRCSHCPVGLIPSTQRMAYFGYTQMQLSDYIKIADEVLSKQQDSVLRIHAVGEPILWENLLPAIKYTAQQRLKTWLFTCGITQDQNLLCELCKYINIIEISVNSANKENYLQTKGVDAFDLVSSNIQLMHDYIVAEKLSTRLIVSRVESTEKEDDKLFIQYWLNSKLVDDAFVRSYHNYNQLLNNIAEEKQHYKKMPCLVHWARFNVNLDGKVVICFNELFKKHLNPQVILGDINKQTIEEIWNSHYLNMIRQAELNNDYSLLGKYGDIPCKSCRHFQSLGSNEATSENQIEQITLTSDAE